MKLYKILALIPCFLFLSCFFSKTTKKSDNINNTYQDLICLNNKLSLDFFNIKKIDTVFFEEGIIYNITTKESNTILLLCGGNADLLNGKDYKALDTIKLENGKISIRGINTSSNQYWRKDRNLIYARVNKDDTAKYNRIFNDKMIYSKIGDVPN